MAKLTEILSKNLKKGALIAGFGLMSLGMNAQTMTQADFGVIRGSDPMDSAKVTISMVDNPSITQTKYTDGAYVHFDNVDLGPTSVKPQPQNYKPLSEVIGSGKDHTFNFETKNQPSNAVIYDITGKVVAQLRPEWNGENIASAYWDGTFSNGSQAPNGVYIFSNGKNFSKKFVQVNEGRTIGYQGINPNFEEKVETKNKEIMEKSVNTVTKQYAVLIEPASHDPNMQFLTFRDTVLMQEDAGQNQFGEYADGVPQTQDVRFHLGKTYDFTIPIAGATFNIKEKTNGTIIGTAISDTNGNVLVENVPVGNAYDTVYVEFGGLPAFWSKKNCPLVRPTEIVFQEDTIATDTIYTTLADTGLLVPRRPLDPSPATVTIDQVRPAVFAPWDYNLGPIPAPLDGCKRDIEERIRGPPEYICIEEAVGRPLLYWTEFTGTNKDIFLDFLNKGDSLFYGSEPSPWQEVGTEFDEVFWSNINDYNYENNFYAGQIGFNVRSGNDDTQTTGTLYNDPNYGLWAGWMELSLNENGFYKEMYGRRTEAEDVNEASNGGEDSYMNSTASSPSLTDRAIFKYKLVEDKNKYLYKKSTWGAGYTAPSDLNIEYHDGQ